MKLKHRNVDQENADNKNKEVEKLLRELIDAIKDQSSSSGSREQGKWTENQLDSLRKLFEDLRLDNVNDLRVKVFNNIKDNMRAKVNKNDFETALLDNVPSLNRKAVSNIAEI